MIASMCATDQHDTATLSHSLDVSVCLCVRPLSCLYSVQVQHCDGLMDVIMRLICGWDHQ